MGLKMCQFDGFPFELDLETARRSIEAGWPAVELWRCLNGHSRWDDLPDLHPRQTAPAQPYLCPACGKPVDRSRGSARKYCSDPCMVFVARQRGLARAAGRVLVMEAEPWYRGRVTVFRDAEALPPLDPLSGRIPAAWSAGWLRVHGLEPLEPAA